MTTQSSIQQRWFILLLLSLSGVTAGCGGASSNSSTDQPESPRGTAASFSELCSQAGVLFCDDFEGGIKSGWSVDGDVAVIPGNAKAGEGNNVLELKTYGAIQSSKLIYTFANQDVVHIRYDVKYAADYDNSGGSHGPILGGSMNPPWGMFGHAGTKPNGSDYFFHSNEPIGTIGQGAEFGFYSYFVNMTSQWGSVFTANQQAPYTIVRGEWTCVEYNLKLNTPGTTTDGMTQFWINGILHGDYSGFQWRTDASLRINTFALDSFNHFNNGARTIDSPNRVQYDNVIISTSYIGCL